MAAMQLPSTHMGVTHVLEPSADCDHCHIQYQQDLQAAADSLQQAERSADAQYQQDVAIATSVRDQAMQECDANCQGARVAADDTLLVKLLFCHSLLMGAMTSCALIGITPLSWFSLGMAAALCIAMAHAAYAARIVDAKADHTTAVETARQFRDLCIANAHLAYQTAVSAAEGVKLAMVMAAVVAHQVAVTAAMTARDACLAACESGGGNRVEVTTMRRVNLVDLVVAAMR